MKILLTANTSFKLVNFRSALIRALIADGHELVGVVPEDEHTDRLRSLGVRIVSLRMDNKGTSPARDAALMLRLWRVFRRERPDAILGYTIKNNIYGALAARALGIPFLPNVTGLGTAFIRGGLLTRVAHALYRLSFAWPRAVFFQNEDDSGHFLAARLVRRDQIRHLPGSGIDLVHFEPTSLPAPEGCFRFLLVARMLRDKGVVEFVEAARSLRERYPHAVFQLLGPIGAANQTAVERSEIDGWVCEGVVEYLGTTDDVRPWIARAQCVVLPSYREGTPRTLLEAAAMARPVIATDVPGCRQVVEDGISGFLCRVRDAADLAHRMQDMMGMECRARARMGAAGRAKMEREFDERLVVAAYRSELACLSEGRQASSAGLSGARRKAG